MPDATTRTYGRTYTPEESMGFMMWPENPNWSFQFIRMAGVAPVGGGDFTEAYLALRDVVVNDIDGWFTSLYGLGERLERAAEKADEEGHRVSARSKWLRACNYYRSAGFFYTPSDRRGIDGITARRRCFQAAARLSNPAITPVEVPYEDTTLPGYLFASLGPAAPRPAVIVMGGGDAVAEEMYFHLGKPLTDRGFTVLAIDGPGQGEALRRGLVARYDWEVPIGACINYLERLGVVDNDRIAVASESLGGYYAARAAAFEHRLAACVIWGGVWEFPANLTEDPDADWVPNLLSLFGAGSLDEARRMVSRFTLDGVAGQITCPTLVIAGDAEGAFTVPAGAAYPPDAFFEANPKKIFDSVGAGDKTLIRYPIGSPGATHCQLDSIIGLQEDLSDWLESKLMKK